MDLENEPMPPQPVLARINSVRFREQQRILDDEVINKKQANLACNVFFGGVYVFMFWWWIKESENRN